MTIINPKNITGVTSITTPSGSDNLFTVHTNNTTERVRINNDGDVIVGSGITVSPDGDIFTTGVTTSTTFSGNFSGGTISGTTGTFTGDVAVSGANITLADGDKIKIGSGSDLELYHASGSTYIDNSEGHLYIQNGGSNDDSNIYIRAKDGEDSIIIQDDGQVELYYDNSVRLETSSTGVSITGQLDLSSHLDMGDNDVVKLGDGDDLQLYHDGSNSYVKNYVGNLFINANDQEKSIACVPDGTVELYHDNSKKFETTSDGATQYGNLTIPDTDAKIILKDGNNFIQFLNTDKEFKFMNAWGAGEFTFYPGGSERVRINPNGLCFNGDTASANALDDYEEGSFTPKIGGNSNSSTYFENGTGTYIKIGRQISVSIRFNAIDLDNNAAGDAKIFNLPFSAGLQPTNGVTAVTNNVQYYNVPFGTDYISNWYLSSGTTSWQGLVSRSNTTWTAFPASDFHAANVYINFFGTYFTS